MRPELKEAVVHGSKEYPFAVYDVEKPGASFHVSLHWHEEIEIVYVYEGPLHLTIENQNYIGQKGNVFIINSKEIHEMHVQNHNVRYGTILFPPTSLLFHEADDITRTYIQPLCTGNVMFSHMISNAELSSEIFSIITCIHKINKQKIPAYRLGTKALLLQIIYLLFHYHQEISSPVPRKNSLLNREILSYIGEHYTTDLTLKDIADTFHMSYKYFSRYFKNNFQTTLSDYLIKLRMERAELLLSTTELSVTEISLQTGFNNISFFIRSFKKAYGQTPLKYRNRKTADVELK